ncbi:hypothetical protein IWX92DRAFT_353372 [Phyllosticta citricarpa]
MNGSNAVQSSPVQSSPVHSCLLFSVRFFFRSFVLSFFLYAMPSVSRGQPCRVVSCRIQTRPVRSFLFPLSSFLFSPFSSLRSQ